MGTVPDGDGNVPAMNHGTAAKEDGTLYLMETVMYMLVIMVKLPSGRRARKRGSTPGIRSIRWKVLKSRKIIF